MRRRLRDMMACQTRAISPLLAWLRPERKGGVTSGEIAVRCVVRGWIGAPDSIWGSDAANAAPSCGSREMERWESSRSGAGEEMWEVLRADALSSPATMA